MKRILYAAAGCIMVFLCCGCEKKAIITEQQEQIDISLSWWGKDERNEYTLDAIEEFEKLHPEIKVSCKYSDSSGYQARYNVQKISGTEADVMQINYAWLEEYSHNGDGYYDLNTLSEYIDFSSFSENDLNYGMMNGRLNAIPIALNTMTVYINKTLYEQYGLDIPRSWEDFFDAAKVMDNEVYPLAMSSKPLWFAAVSYAEQVTGKQFMAQDGTISFNAGDVQIMLEFYKELIENKIIPQIEYFDKLNLSSGTYAGCVLWLSDADYVEDAINAGYEYVVMDYPTSTAIGAGWYGKPATMYAISSNTEHPKESAMLLDYLLNSTEMAGRQGIEKGIPISKKARAYLESHDMLTGIKYEAFLKMEEFSHNISILSFYFENNDILDEFTSSCNVVLYEKNDAYAEAQRLLDAITEIINENRFE